MNQILCYKTDSGVPNVLMTDTVNLALKVSAMASSAKVLIACLAKVHYGLVLIEKFYLFGFRLMMSKRLTA